MRFRSNIFQKYPFLYFVAAVIVLANNLFKFSPGYILVKPYNVVIPLALIAFGAVGYATKYLYKKKDSES